MREMKMDETTVAHWEDVSGRPWEKCVEPRVSKHSLLTFGTDGNVFLDNRKFRSYFGVSVEVVQSFEHCALIRRTDGLSCVVETVDLGAL